jgi:very-short-patch-repair endonuclease
MAQFSPRPTRVAQILRNNATDAEKCLWCRLSRRQLGGFKFSRQMPVGTYICDFMCREAQLVIELDGGQHDARAPLDRKRTSYIESQGYRVLRFWNNDVLGNVDGVLTVISDVLRGLELSPHPHPSRKREGSAPATSQSE